MTTKSITPLRFIALSTLMASLTTGCGSDAGNPSGGTSSTKSAQVLDPAVEHYGHTDAEWATLWWRWVFEMPHTAESCVLPFMDPTGEHCADSQSGDVFFLAGTTENVAVRKKCAVPKGKALFFPILSFTNDNAGYEPDKLQTEDEMIDFLQKQMDGVPVDQMAASLDDRPITDVARFATDITKFSYTLPEEPNTYTCYGANGVTGLVDPAYATGYWVMLPPPAAGAHVLHFEGHAPDFPLDVDVTYQFTIK